MVNADDLIEELLNAVVQEQDERVNKAKNALSEAVAKAYGEGVTAGKKEALRYNLDERLNYVKLVAFADGFKWSQQLKGQG